MSTYLQTYFRIIKWSVKIFLCGMVSILLYAMWEFHQTPYFSSNKIYQTWKGERPQLPKTEEFSTENPESDVELIPNFVKDPANNTTMRSDDIIYNRPVNYSEIWMSREETDVILRYMRKGVQKYLEWGSGGSTLNFAPLAHGKAYSIEHDKTWCNDMQKELLNKTLTDKIEYHCVSVEKGHRGWGLASPFEEGTYAQFDLYIDEIDKLGEPIFDVVLIDGRARVSAAIKVLAYISKSSHVIVHDGKRIREKRKPTRDYSDIEKYYDIVEYWAPPSSTGIAVLKRKAQWHWLQGNVNAVNKLLKE